ncbi:MAG TPA: class I SAM-dependent methyltransferase [Thermodesulfobacteriota bacterium]|nr:class I SAM-dependent methyltransferase [Thermodesulfobacteriota bacterium]
MKRKEWGRRQFLAGTGAALAVFAAASGHSPARAQSPTGKSDPARIRKLLREMEAQGPRYWSVPREDGEFLHLLVRATQARSVLEVGTSHGYSAVWIGLALEETGGRLISIEIEKERHELARKHVEQAGLSARVALIRGNAHDEVGRLDGPFEFVFLDADKGDELDYFKKLYPGKLAPGAVLAVHNAISAAGSMKAYLDTIRKHADFDTVTLSVTMQDGFCLSCRRRK